MVGNVWEWLGGNWVPRSTDCGSWSFAGGDGQCLAGADTSSTTEPGALIRGGDFNDDTFAVFGGSEPSSAFGFDGFGVRCVR